MVYECIVYDNDLIYLFVTNNSNNKVYMPIINIYYIFIRCAYEI